MSRLPPYENETQARDVRLDPYRERAGILTSAGDRDATLFLRSYSTKATATARTEAGANTPQNSTTPQASEQPQTAAAPMRGPGLIELNCIDGYIDGYQPMQLLHIDPTKWAPWEDGLRSQR